MAFRIPSHLLQSALAGLLLATLLPAGTQAAPIAGLTAAPARAINPTSSIQQIDFARRPTSNDVAALRQAGFTPLAYLPPNGYLVRVSAGSDTTVLNGLGATSTGAHTAARKRSPSLAVTSTSNPAESLQFRVLVSPDASPDALLRALPEMGLKLMTESSGLHGTSLIVEGPVGASSTLATRDDVLWIGRTQQPVLQNSAARGILGVPAAREQLGLDGTGQIIAITDSGLDASQNLSADFAGRIAAAFGPGQMSTRCTSTDWSDFNGHGTHVAGSALGSGALSAGQHAGVAPNARIVVQSARDEKNPTSGTLSCLPAAADFLAKGYTSGARIHSASFNMTYPDAAFDYEIDAFLWEHKDYLFVVSAGNSGTDANADGVVDTGSILSPATAKNVLSVGASENVQPARPGLICAEYLPSCTWQMNRFWAQPLTTDPVSDNADGVAAFSARGPSIDGRIKPEVLAPGTSVLSARTHAQISGRQVGAYYPAGNDYAYLSGTSMATPMVAGSAALLRQWLAQPHANDLPQLTNPSAALLKALLMNGTAPQTAGQYGTGTTREIPEAWPNNVAGWGRVQVSQAVGLNTPLSFWDETQGLVTGGERRYMVELSPGQSFRASLVWTDAPMPPFADDESTARRLVNDLDLTLIGPDGVAIAPGNHTASLPATCRDVSTGADRCNNAESIAFSAPKAGQYTLLVKAAYVAPELTQPFALVATGTRAIEPPTSAPALTAEHSDTSAAVLLRWNDISGASTYELEQHQGSISATQTNATIASTTEQEWRIVREPGTYLFRVRGCNSRGCGPFSAPVQVDVRVVPLRSYTPLILR